VPQIRERFFLIGLPDKKFVFPQPTHAKVPDGSLFDELKPWMTAGEAIGDLDTEEAASDEGHVAGGKDHDLLLEVPPGDNYLFFTEERGYPNPKFKWRSRYWSFLLKLSPKLPSWTIQARRSNNMGPFHWRNRILRIEEVKRLQTFPDDWTLRGNVDQQWRQVGNAVPPVLAEVLGAAIRDQMTGEVRSWQETV
jgi:DNA (cytosine-5)-methyltransferase 1